MAEEYTAKMATKSLAELLQYVAGRYQYREDAVLAALDELARRGQPHAEAAAIRPSLEAVVREQQARAAALPAPEPFAGSAPTAEADDLSTAPALYSPFTVAMFSILFSVLAGAVLMVMNLLQLGRKRAALALGLFSLGYLLVVPQLLLLGMSQWGLSPFIAALLFNVPPLLVYLLWFWPRYVHVPDYRSRSVLLPILIAFALAWGAQQLMPYLLKQQPKAVQDQVEQLLKR